MIKVTVGLWNGDDNVEEDLVMVTDTGEGNGLIKRRLIITQAISTSERVIAS